MKEAVEQGAVMQEEVTEVFVNGKNAVSVDCINEFKRHGGSAFHGIFVAAGRAKTAVAAERNKFSPPTVGTAVYGATKSRITAVNHFLHVFYDRSTWMQDVNYFFVMVFENIL